MPMTAIQSRIAAFESLANGGGGVGGGAGGVGVVSPSPSPPNLGRRTSLIDLKDWVVEQPPVINFAPPLPPRKPSHSSLKSVASSSNSLSVDHTYPPLKINADSRSSSHAPASSISSFHSVSLSDTPFYHKSATESDAVSLGESYEEVSTPSIITSPATERNISVDWDRAMAKQQQKQVPPKLPQRPSISRSPSSSSSPSVPTSPNYRPSSLSPSVTRKPPPPPPSRSSASDRASIHSTSTATSYTSHPRSQSTPHLKPKRPTPVPPAARVRYDAVFNANIVQRRKAERHAPNPKPKERPALLSPAEARGASRRAAGWRGLSVDLITGGQDHPVVGSSQSQAGDNEEVSAFVGPAEKLEGHLVKTIWRRSRLGRKVLRDVWNECDPDGTGSLNRDQFATGMWRLDEELRRAQLHALKSTSTGSLASHTHSQYSGRSGSLFRPPPPPIPSRKPILR